MLSRAAATRVVAPARFEEIPRMIRSRLLWLLIPTFLLLMGLRQAPLVDPDPITIPAGLSAQDVARAIKMSLINRTWTVTREAPGEIDATLNLRDHVARIAITYDDAQVRIAYLSSENLKFEEKRGTRYIHKNYLSWINNLTGDISRQLQMLSME